ncbi:hypothetical protein HBI65_205760 [Parastagonospora nodorum]|nr:hypothetical protein HBI65_205760 [Parastagonospora nodorum]
MSYSWRARAVYIIYTHLPFFVHPIPDVQDITNPAEHAQYRRDADAQTQPPRDAHLQGMLSTAAMLMHRPSLRGMLSTDADENSNYPARVVCGATALGTYINLSFVTINSSVRKPLDRESQ